MKAIVYEKYGAPEVHQLKEVEKPTPKDNEILVKIHASAINSSDATLTRGKPFLGRLWQGFLKPKNKTLGSDISGKVEAVGSSVKEFKEGDEVFGDIGDIGFGGFAQYVAVPETTIVLKPSNLTFEEAAVVPQASVVALQGLRNHGQIQQGQKLLINGAGGGVGTFAVQIAKLYKVEITGVDSSGKLDMLRSMGFDHVIDYTQEDFTKNKQCYDLILDVKTNRCIFDYTRALSPNGIYATVGGTTSRLLQAFILGPWISMISKKKIRIIALKQNKDLVYMNELFEAGKVKPVIDGRYKLSEVPEAMQYFGEGKHKGKVVITV